MKPGGNRTNCMKPAETRGLLPVELRRNIVHLIVSYRQPEVSFQ